MYNYYYFENHQSSLPSFSNDHLNVPFLFFIDKIVSNHLLYISNIFRYMSIQTMPGVCHKLDIEQLELKKKKLGLLTFLPANLKPSRPSQARGLIVGASMEPFGICCILKYHSKVLKL